VLKDRILFEESAGGVTLSGGEPLLQKEFCLEFLCLLKKGGIHTVVDTCGYVSWADLKEVALLTDIFLYDLKLLNAEKSRAFTGVTNDLILLNLENLVSIHCNVKVRIPVIPGVNDDARSINEKALFLSKIGIQEVEIIPYHTLGTGKYDKLSRKYRLNKTPILSETELIAIEQIFNRKGIIVLKNGENSYGK